MNNQIIVAMDNEIQDGIELIAKTECSKEIYAYKIGSLWTLDKGIQILKDLKDTVLKESERKIILDMQKWGTDIPDIVKKQVNKVAPFVDELIVCPMGGGSDSLMSFARSCYENNVKPICVLEMTHPNSGKYLINGSKSMILEDCYNCGIKSFVLPATKEPDKTFKALIEFYFGENTTTLYATGFKTQGGQTEPMVKFGVSKFIVGRAIYEAKDPIKAIEDIYKEINQIQL